MLVERVVIVNSEDASAVLNAWIVEHWDEIPEIEF